MIEERRDMFDLAGWLFADLLVALALLFSALGGFGAAVIPGKADLLNDVQESAVPSPVSADTVCVVVPISVALRQTGRAHTDAVRALENAVRTQMAPLVGRRAVIVQIFAENKDPVVADELSLAVMRVLQNMGNTEPDLRSLFAEARYRPWHQLRTTGNAWIEIFLVDPPEDLGTSESRCRLDYRAP